MHHTDSQLSGNGKCPGNARPPWAFYCVVALLWTWATIEILTGW